ncbi:hypothetical protein [Tessaracoccus aquimaris]|nr:hypothetical protein [Tessaracoccus aquimaris]
MPESSPRHVTVTESPQPTAADMHAYREQLAAFRKRKNWALVVGIVATVLAVASIALGGALALGQFNTQFLNTRTGEWVAQRHVPGASGTVSLPDPGRYAITKPDGVAPACTVADMDGTAVPVAMEQLPEANGKTLQVFDAEKATYTVTCEGGQSGVVVFAVDDLPMVVNGWVSELAKVAPFLILGVALLVVGRIVPRRIAPESMRPVIPS